MWSFLSGLNCKRPRFRCFPLQLMGSQGYVFWLWLKVPEGTHVGRVFVGLRSRPRWMWRTALAPWSTCPDLEIKNKIGGQSLAPFEKKPKGGSFPCAEWSRNMGWPDPAESELDFFGANAGRKELAQLRDRLIFECGFVCMQTGHQARYLKHRNRRDMARRPVMVGCPLLQNEFFQDSPMVNFHGQGV